MTVHAFPALSNAQQVRDALPASLAPRLFPEDAHALIYKPARSAMTSGKAGTHEWKLRFDRRTPPFIEPLMGWTGGDDTLTQVELSFPTAESAIAYAQRQGLHYTVVRRHQRVPGIRIAATSTEEARAAATARRQRLEWVERTLGPDLIREGFGPGADPSASYAAPQDVVSDPALIGDQKRDLLRRWALDAYLLDLAFSSGASEFQNSRLQEVIEALIDLERMPSKGGEQTQQGERQMAAGRT
jgi:hypothetical protein